MTGNYEVFVANLDGTGLVNLTNNPADDASPTWSPNGKRLAFVSNRTRDSLIYVMNPATKKVEVLTRSGPKGQTNPYWCTDRKIVFGADGEIYVADTRDGSSFNLTKTPKVIESQPVCTPRGDRVLFHSSQSDAFRSIYDMPITGGAQRRLTPSGWPAIDVDVRPDGKAFLFFGRSRQGKVALWENRYEPKGRISWKPRSVVVVKPPRELRLNRYAPTYPVVWLPGFKSRAGFTIFGTNLAKGSAGPPDLRSIVRIDAADGSVDGYFFRRRRGEDASPVVRPLTRVFRKGTNLGVAGTQGSDLLVLGLTAGRTAVRPAPGLSLWDENRSVPVSAGINYGTAFANVVVKTLSGNDRVTVTGTPRKGTKLLLNCGAGNDSVFASRKLLPLLDRESCEHMHVTG